MVELIFPAPTALSCLLIRCCCMSTEQICHRGPLGTHFILHMNFRFYNSVKVSIGYTDLIDVLRRAKEGEQKMIMKYDASKC